MDKRKVQRWLLAAVLAAVLMAPFVLQRGNLNKLRSENAQLAARVRELSAAVQRAETNAAQKASMERGGALSKDQLLELMRLRAEVTALRKITNSAAGAVPAAVTGTSAEVAASAEAVQEAPGTNGPPWTFRGYSRPEDTISTYVWGLEQGRMDVLMNSATPEAQAQIQRAFQTATNSVERMQSEAKKIVEVRPSATHPPTENEVYLTIVVQEPAQQRVMEENAQIGNLPVPAGTSYTQGAQQITTTVKLQRVGNDWKFAGKVEGRGGVQ